jgi:outer membrane protein TolC
MMRWVSAWCGLVLAVCFVSGCGSRTFLTKNDYDDAHNTGSSLLPPSLEKNYTIGEKPLSEPTAPPPTVNTPDRPPRYLSLQEAIAIALESGTASSRGGVGSGIYDMNMVNSTPIIGAGALNLTNQTDNLRVLALEPALGGANIEAAASRFDAHWISLMTWNVTDNLLQGLNSFSNGTSSTGSTSIVKQLPSGGFVSTTLQENYQLLSAPPTSTFAILNPLYTSSLILGFEQPLWRNAGVRVNQLLGSFSNPTTNIGVPQQVSNQYSNRQPQGLFAPQLVSNDGILVARLRFDQSRADFERVVQGLVLNVEVAYWNLYNAYGQLYSYEEALRIAHKTWMISYSKQQVGQQTDADVGPVRGQYEDFRGQRTTALGLVIESERNLRGILGLPIEDGTRIVPMTPPSLAHFYPDWESSVRDALNLRPEMVLARDNLRLAQYNLEVAENFLKPDIRFAAQYNPTGFGTTLTGRGTFLDGTNSQQTSNSLQSLASGHFANYTIGLTANVPFGFRMENAALRAARISLAQNYYLVKDQERRATHYCYQQYEEMQKWYNLLQVRKQQRKSYALAVETYFKQIQLGKGQFDVNFRDLVSRLADAQVKEYQAVAEYNNTLAKFEFSKGTVLKFNNVHIAEGEMPQCVQVRAVEHLKERSKAILLHERPDPMTHPGRLADTQNIPASDVPLPLAVFNRPPEAEYLPLPLNKGEPGEAPAGKVEDKAAPAQGKLPPGPGFAPVEKLEGPALSLPSIPALPALPMLPSADSSLQTPAPKGDAIPAVVPAQLPEIPTPAAIAPLFTPASRLTEPGVIPAPTLPPSTPPGNAPRN